MSFKSTKLIILCLFVWENSHANNASNDSDEAIEVLHWWTSQSEQAAVNHLKVRLQSQDINWIDAAIAGGAGDGAMAVLKTKIITGTAPDAAQIIGPDIKNWASLGFLNHLDVVGLVQDWPQRLYPTVDELVRHEGRYVAAPFGIHRINWLWVNSKILNAIDETPPENWDDFFKIAEKLKEIGIIPLAHGNEPWQNVTLFENIVLSLGGPEFYNDVFINLDSKAIESRTFMASLNLLRKLKLTMDDNINGRSWTQASSLLTNNQAAMQIMGDWAKAEFNQINDQNNITCVPVPQTKNLHLYSIDTMVMFNNEQKTASANQFTLADIITSPSFQQDYNLAKGSIPAIIDVNLQAFDDCARSSQKDFLSSQNNGNLAPSLAHSMAATAQVEDIFIDLIDGFFQDSRITASRAQKQLVKSLSSIRKL